MLHTGLFLSPAPLHLHCTTSHPVASSVPVLLPVGLLLWVVAVVELPYAPHTAHLPHHITHSTTSMPHVKTPGGGHSPGLCRARTCRCSGITCRIAVSRLPCLLPPAYCTTTIVYHSCCYCLPPALPPAPAYPCYCTDPAPTPHPRTHHPHPPAPYPTTPPVGSGVPPHRGGGLPLGGCHLAPHYTENRHLDRRVVGEPLFSCPHTTAPHYTPPPPRTTCTCHHPTPLPPSSAHLPACSHLPTMPAHLYWCPCLQTVAQPHPTPPLTGCTHHSHPTLHYMPTLPTHIYGFTHHILASVTAPTQRGLTLPTNAYGIAFN